MAITVKQSMKLGAFMLVAAAVATAPITVSAATDSASTTVSATVGSTISVSSNGTVSLSLTPTGGSVVSSASDTVTVSTNNTNGYSLTLQNADAASDLTSGGNTIGAHAGTVGAPTALAANTWGFAVGGLGTFDASYIAEDNATSSATKWAGVPTSGGTAATLKSTATTAANDNTVVWYAANVDTNQPTGTYTDTVTYTATTN